MNLNIKHYLNPLHIYCRMRDIGFSKGTAKSLCRIYECSLFWNLFMRQSKRKCPTDICRIPQEESTRPLRRVKRTPIRIRKGVEGEVPMRDTKKKIVILGMGFAGAHASVQISERLKDQAEITVVDMNNYHLFKPMLHEFATGSVEPGHIMQPIMQILRGRNPVFDSGMVQAIDMSRRLVSLCRDCIVCHQQDSCPIKDFSLTMEDIQRNGASVLPYDYLILALGGIPNFYDIEGAREYAFPINNLEDADKIKKHILHAFAIAGMVRDVEKRKQILTFAIVGAGPTGLETANELHDWIYKALSKEFTAIKPEEIKIYLIEAGRDILPASPREVRLTAKKYLREKRISLLTEAPVIRVGKNFLETKKGLMKAFTVIWAAGIKGHDLLRDTGLSVDAFGRVVVNPYLSPMGYDDVFAIGDCTSYTPPGAVHPLPQTGQVAVQEARYIAKSLPALLEGDPVEPFKYRELGSAISAGHYKGFVSLLGLFRLQGFTGWMAWKFTYLKHLISIRLSVRSLLEWLFDLTYDREATRHKF